MNIKKILIVAALTLSATQLVGCGGWVKQGKVGLRVNYDNTIERDERPAGSFYQNIIGHTFEVPVKEIAVDVMDMKPQASDGSTMSDFDVTAVYSINPTQVAELYIDRNKSFHSTDDNGETLLMHKYLENTIKNAVYKVARLYPALTMNDARGDIEIQIKDAINASLAAEKLGNAVSVSQVMAKSMLPSEAVKAAADKLVAAQGELRVKETELQTAQKEAQRIATLNANAQAIPYMNAQANLLVAEGVKAGKVNTIVVPMDFKGIVNTK